ncbi:MAG: DUF1854 domain-containing protein [Burkholderiaceae bacterium]|nr:DUF1854 domain-containing protein [Burkholderiaceae bacterium]MCU0966891.1 DUF1854 domain-containing protein [Burkholderiaceae bacterium]
MSFDLQRNAFGRLVLTDGDGVAHEGVVPVRAFPIAAPGEGLSLLSAEGHELVWIDRLGDLSPRQRELVEEELSSREFAPEIRRLLAVSTFATPSTWTVDTDRGTTQFVLKGEEDIRRIGRSMLLIADSQGLQFRVRDLTALDRPSRRLLERFL